MSGWFLDFFYKIKGVMKNPIFNSVTYYVIIAVILLYIGFFLIPKIMSGFGFLSEKEKLLVANTTQEKVIKDLSEANDKLNLQLHQCNELNVINKNEVTNFDNKVKDNKEKIDTVLVSKKDIIEKITGKPKPKERIVYEDKTTTIPKEKVIAVSTVQINSLWGEYEKVISK